MKRTEVLTILTNHQAEIRATFGVSSLALFGSVARDEAGPESDVDLLVEFEGPITFDRYIELQFFLEDLLGHPVDLLTRAAIRPPLWSHIEPEVIHVA